ncbi:MAG: hypothetical protein LIP23_04465 [Planctomycetes bacterium]|nr:hypothetical protein [Planctomycetota bacterium]
MNINSLGNSAASGQVDRRNEQQKYADSVHAGLRTMFGMEVVDDKTSIDGNGNRQGWSGVAPKGGKKTLFETIEKMQEKLDERAQEKAQEKRLEDRLELSASAQVTVETAKPSAKNPEPGGMADADTGRGKLMD